MLAPAPAALVFSELALPLPQALSRPTAPEPRCRQSGARRLELFLVASWLLAVLAGHGSGFLLSCRAGVSRFPKC